MLYNTVFYLESLKKLIFFASDNLRQSFFALSD